jgi:hypothetical protein
MGSSANKYHENKSDRALDYSWITKFNMTRLHNNSQLPWIRKAKFSKGGKKKTPLTDLRLHGDDDHIAVVDDLAGTGG